ncbi:alpha/beta hydrolase [Ramlibacter sp. AW1]|uniref:Alpha/beta hydrolase n=1 Tax=Ramlibacter aurantiacus TaxID=2801330 RepID=A0A937D3E4_9BURK|nr:alpha/beta hydrolase [Ramlibacter aurantiacus]MBL0420635.1 alpha/beta hydrolase [Ramlibacter aurantiacus]
MNLTQLSQRFPPRSVSTAGGRISLREARPAAGEAGVLVLLHGIGSASGSWVRQLDALGASHRVLAWDAPGYGDSEPLPMPRPTPHDYGRRVWQWLDALELDTPVTLVGHSLGALMASAAAVQQPERVKRLLLLAPAQGYGKADEAVRAQKRDDRLRNLDTLGPAGMAEKRGAAMLSPQAPAETVAYVRSVMAQVHPEGYRQATHMLAESDLAELLPQVRAPITVASGSADGITPAAGCRSLAERAGVPYVPLGEVGHSCALEAADALVPLIRENS